MTESGPIEALEQALSSIARYDRPDLTRRLSSARRRLSDDRIRVLVVGEFKQGKSMLINGLVTAPICPVFDDVATSVPTVVHYAENTRVTVVKSVEGITTGDGSEDSRTERVEIKVEQLADYVSEAGNPNNERQLSFAEVGIPRQVLTQGLEVVDTPGVGGLHSVHGAATMAALPSADAVLLVSDASQEYTEPELEFLRQAVKVCPNVACVLTKTDLYPEWRRIADLDRAHLKAAGIDAQLFTVASTLRMEAAKLDDQELNEESGFPALVKFLRHAVVGQADLLARRSTVHDIVSVTNQVATSLQAEQKILQNPGDLDELLVQLTSAEERAAALKEKSARWQTTLADGITDLNADIEYDLRDRLREILRLAEEEITDGGDPTKTWDQFASWVEQEVATASAATWVWANQRVRFLADQVADHFNEDAKNIETEIPDNAGVALGAVKNMSVREGEPWGAGQKALTAMRGSYMGVLMFGLLGTVVGLSLINPLSVTAGVLLGGKAITDERRRITSRRQNDARMAVRRYIDDSIFQVSTQSRENLRIAQRALRDHFTDTAEEMRSSINESIQAAQKAVQTTQGDRKNRLGEIKRELGVLTELQRNALTLLPDSQPTVVEGAVEKPAIVGGSTA